MLIATRQLASQASAPTQSGWSSNNEQVANQAIDRFGLASKGWMGFDKLPWVAELKKDCPAAIKLAETCSSHDPIFRDQANDLFAHAQPQDRQRIQDYFAGKTGLEELSCRRSGPEGGLCDKKGAFYQILDISREYMNPAQREGIYL